MTNPKIRVFLALAVPLFLTDCATKALVVEDLVPHVPHAVLGDLLRFTLATNVDAAMSISLGPFSRWGLAGFSIAAVVVLLGMLRRAAPNDRARAVALALLVGGALGNLWDRLRWDRGVVDFIDVGLGSARFWTFNVADMGITIGAIALMLVIRAEHLATMEPRSS